MAAHHPPPQQQQQQEQQQQQQQTHLAHAIATTFKQYASASDAPGSSFAAKQSNQALEQLHAIGLHAWVPPSCLCCSPSRVPMRASVCPVRRRLGCTHGCMHAWMRMDGCMHGCMHGCAHSPSSGISPRLPRWRRCVQRVLLAHPTPHLTPHSTPTYHAYRAGRTGCRPSRSCSRTSRGRWARGHGTPCLIIIISSSTRAGSPACVGAYFRTSHGTLVHQARTTANRTPPQGMLPDQFVRFYRFAFHLCREPHRKHVQVGVQGGLRAPDHGRASACRCFLPLPSAPPACQRIRNRTLPPSQPRRLLRRLLPPPHLPPHTQIQVAVQAWALLMAGRFRMVRGFA